MTGGERIGWVLSIGLHTAVVVLFVSGLPMFDRDRDPVPLPISVEFVRVDEVTRVTEPEPEKPAEAPQEDTPNVAKAENVPETAAEAVPLPEPAPKPVVKAKPKPKVTENQKLHAKVRPQSKPKPPSRVKSKRLAALIDKSIKEEKTPVKAADKPVEKTEEKPDPFAGLRGRIATASLRDALSQKLAGCWNFPGGAKGIANMAVTVRIWLRGDGTLSKPPEFIDAGDLNDGFYRTFAESARRAVVLCEPFTEAGDYIATGRKYIDFNFNGAEFGGG